MTTNNKTRRTAHEDDRERVQAIVDFCNEVQNSENDNYCLNPEDAPEEQTFFNKNEIAKYLIAELTKFVETGTFANAQINMTRFLVREKYKVLRNSGITYEEAINSLAEDHAKSTRTIERMVSPTNGDTNCR